jgi:hypothetical protein
MHRYFQIIIFVLFAAVAAAQAGSQPMRLELEARPNTEPYQLVPLAEKGFLVLFKSNEFEDRNNRKWNFAFYNANMDLQWEFIRSILRNHEYGAYATYGNEISLLFFDPRTSSESNLQILTFNPESKQHNIVEGSIDRRFDLMRFSRHKNYCYLGMNSKNACKAYNIHVHSGDLQTLELNPDGGTYIENINIDTLANEVVILTSLRNERRRNALFLHRFNENAVEKSFEPVLKNENRKMVTSAQHLVIDENRSIVLGSFTSNPPRRGSSSFEPEGNTSNGFYKVLIDRRDKTPLAAFYNFGDLTNIDNYIRGTIAEKRQRSLRRWFQRKKSATLEYHLVMHNIKKHAGSFLLAGEAFSPDYRTVTTVAYDYYGRPVPRTYSVFDGYRYSHAVVVAFDENGQLLWDNGMEMINVKTFDLSPKLVMHNEDNDLVMAYNHDGKIAWKFIREKKTVTNISYANIETKYSKDRVNNEQSSQLIPWYEHYFLATGYQTIINNYLPSQNRRNVFYINKIVFD